MASTNDKMPDSYIPPDTPPKCTWSLEKKPADSPHHHEQKRDPNVGGRILNNILEMVGNTPMVRLDKIAKSEGLECELLAKCEFFNAGGSVKDRIGLRMVEEAEKDGILKPGDTIIEPTSGNTGLGLALTSAVKGYRCIMCLPEKMSNEKVAVLRALGAEIRRTPTEAAFDDPESHLSVCWKLHKEIPNSHVLDQYRNPGNPLAHYDGTASEILAQCGGKLDMVVGGTGTGGTLAGIGRKIKEQLPSVEIVGVDPIGSILAQPDELNKNGEGAMYHVEGIGLDFVTTVFDRSVVDRWFKCEDRETFHYARRLIREEGLLCGGSSGAAVAAAVKAARSLKAGQRCVVILPDSIRNYITKFADDKWLLLKGMKDPEGPLPSWWDLPLSSLHPLRTLASVTLQTSCAQAITVIKKEGVGFLPVMGDNGGVVGVVTSAGLISKLGSMAAKSEDPVAKVFSKTFPKVDATDSPNLGRISQLLEKDQYVFVVKRDSSSLVNGPGKKVAQLEGVITSPDFLACITMH